MTYREQTPFKIAQAVRILHHTGLLEVFGHVSARADEESCYILGALHHEGRMLSETVPDSIIKVDLNGKMIEGAGRPPGEVYIHTEIYRRRPDVQAVVHHHGLASITLSVAGEEVRPIWVQATPFIEGTPIFSQPEQIDNPEIGAKVSEVLSQKRAVLLRGHGAVVVGDSVEEACVLAVAMERTARMQLDAGVLGRPVPISRDVLTDGMTRGLSMEELVESYWAYFSAKYPLFKEM
jgi:ribulose-5-phosphate 4-epimerase/fuculose-1-phosphate aldolase